MKFMIAAATIFSSMLGVVIICLSSSNRRLEASHSVLEKWGVIDLVTVESVYEDSSFSLPRGISATVIFRPNVDIDDFEMQLRCPKGSVRVKGVKELACFQGDWGIFLEYAGNDRWKLNATMPP